MTDTQAGDAELEPFAIGDGAVAAGMDILTGAEMANTIDTEENKTRDYIAQFFDQAKALVLSIWPTSRGGTGSANLYGVTTPSAGANTGVLMIKSDGTLARGSGALPPAYIPAVSVNASQVGAGTFNGNFAMSGAFTAQNHIYTPAASPATTNYAVAYLNGDGRLSRGASSRRFKTAIRNARIAAGSLFRPRLREYRMKGATDGEFHVGLIAEELAEHEATARFVVYDTKGRPDAIDSIGLLLAMAYETDARLRKLEPPAGG